MRNPYPWFDQEDDDERESEIVWELGGSGVVTGSQGGPPITWRPPIFGG